jgi:hypothetical protein
MGCGSGGAPGTIRDENGSIGKCRVCDGTGTISRPSPFGVYQLQKPKRLDDGDASITPPPGGYITPDPAILEFLSNQIDKNINAFYTMVNIDISRDTASGRDTMTVRDTATGRLLDREELFSFLLNFSHETFDLLEFAIKSIGNMRYGGEFKMPDIKRPNNFSIRSEADLTQELSSAKADGLPKAYIQALELELAKLRFPQSDAIRARYKLTVDTDVLNGMTVQEISIAKATGAIYDWQVALHYNIDGFIDAEIDTSDTFLSLPEKDQKQKLVDRAKQFITDNKVILPTPDPFSVN